MKKAIENGKVVFTFEGGLEPVVFDPVGVDAGMRAYAELHGWSARLGDAAALSVKRPDGTFRRPTEDERRAEVVRLAGYYEGGAKEWNTRATGGGAGKGQNATIAKVAEARGITYAEAEAYIAEKFLGELGVQL